jgi:hypothetical protein
MANFVMIELELGRTFCDLEKNYKNEGSLAGQLEERGKRSRMEHAAFYEMTAQAERLRFELEAWK